MPYSDMKNRRRTPRIDGAIAIRWRRGTKVITARTINLNAHGLLLQTDETIPLNQLMDLAAELPTGSVSFTAVSRFVGDTQWGHAIGVQIHVASAKDQEAWLKFYREAAAPLRVSRL